jgi:DNA mismatch endonuclease (patch repair protein)
MFLRRRQRWASPGVAVAVRLRFRFAQGARPQGMSYDRSAVMRAVKSRDTGAERAVRAILRPLAPGYRLHRADLPGKPDIVYGPRKLAIFVHGCFWHGHDCPRGARMPKTNADYWRAKIARNRARDEKTLAALAALGWRTLVVYECELRDAAGLKGRLEQGLRTGSPC